MAIHDASNPTGNEPQQAMVGAKQLPGTSLGSPLGLPLTSSVQADPGFRSPDILHRGLDQAGLLNSLRRRWVLATFLGLLVAGLSAIALFLLVPESSKATALIRVRSEQPAILMPVESSVDNTQTYELYAQTQLAKLTSESVLAVALDLPKYRITEIPEIHQEDDKVSWLQDNVNAQMIRDSEFISVSLTDDFTHEELKRVVDAVTNAFITEGVVKENLKIGAQKGDLETASRQLQERLTNLNTKYKELAKQLGTSEADETPIKQQMLLSRMQLNQRQAKELEQGLAEAFLNYHLIRTQQKDSALVDLMVQEQMAQDPSMQMLQQQIMFKESEIYSYKSTTKRQTQGLSRLENERRELVSELNQRQAELKASIASQVETQPNVTLRQAQKMYEVTRQVLGSRLQKLNEDAETMETELMQLAETSAELEAEKSEIEQLQELQASMANRIGLWNVELSAPPRVYIYQPASVKEKINKVTRYFIIASGALIMLGITCFSVGYFEFRNRRLDGPDQVDEGLGIRVIGTLPGLSNRHALREGDPIVAALMESIDSVRTTLMHDSTSKERRVVMVTSPTSVEGRTTVASQLAASLARAGRRTLLIDGDVRHPSIHGLFDLPLEDGLCEVLRAEVDLDDVIRPTHAEGLWVMTAGYCDAEALHALANEQLQPGFDKLRANYDFVIVDGPPTIGLPDALILGQYCDGAILSVLRDYSQVPQVYRATETLRGVGVRLIGAVVNGVRTKPDSRITRVHLAAPKQEEVAEPVGV